jgi:hypothetical protein
MLGEGMSFKSSRLPYPRDRAYFTNIYGLVSKEPQKASRNDICFSGCSLSEDVSANWHKGPETAPYRGHKATDGARHFT